MVSVTTAAEMHEAVMARAVASDVVIMAAAVADYAPGVADAQKLHKEQSSITLTLVRTPDIISELARRRAGGDRPILVGFAAETTDVVAQARKKRKEKGVDLVVANDVSRSDAGFEVDNNEVTIVSADGDEAVPLRSKTAIANRGLDRVEALLNACTPVLK